MSKLADYLRANPPTPKPLPSAGVVTPPVDGRGSEAKNGSTPPANGSPGPYYLTALNGRYGIVGPNGPSATRAKVRLDAVPEVPVGIFVALIDGGAPVSAWQLLMAVYACGRMRRTTAVKLDAQVFELAGIRDQNTQARAIAALDECRAMAPRASARQARDRAPHPGQEMEQEGMSHTGNDHNPPDLPPRCIFRVTARIA